MIRPDEIREGSDQFNLGVVPGVSLATATEVTQRGRAPLAHAGQSSAARELVFSVNQVLVGLVYAFSLTTLFMWAVIRLWLFEP